MGLGPLAFFFNVLSRQRLLKNISIQNRRYKVALIHQSIHSFIRPSIHSPIRADRRPSVHACMCSPQRSERIPDKTKKQIDTHPLPRRSRRSHIPRKIRGTGDKSVSPTLRLLQCIGGSHKRPRPMCIKKMHATTATAFCCPPRR